MVKLPQTALIVIDMLNTYDHEDADRLAACVRKRLPQIVELRDAAKQRDDVKLLYVNDNHDEWEAGRETLIELARAARDKFRIAGAGRRAELDEAERWLAAHGSDLEDHARGPR